MSKNIRLFFFLFIAAGLLSSCEEEKENQMLMSVSGSPGEVIVVATTNQWNGKIGKTIRSNFEKPVYGMPQKEPLFNVVRTNKSDFKRVFETFRNVVIIDLDTNRFSTGEVTYHKNSYARGQLVIRIVGSSRDEIISLFKASSKQIIYTIQSKEFNRLYAAYKAKPNKTIADKLAPLLGVNVTVPQEAVLATSSNEHAWIRLEREKLKGGFMHDISQGILIYKFPYTAKTQFLDENLFAIRDSILKVYIPGPSDGSYMTTEYRYYPPKSKEVDFQGHFAKEIHGLWRVENDFMGGPMATYFVLNEDEGMIYCYSAYAFAPQFDKREYYREAEAMVKPIQFISGPTNTEK